MTEVEQTRELFTAPSTHSTQSHISPDHRRRITSSSSLKDCHHKTRHTVHHPHRHRSPQSHPSQSGAAKRALPPGWEVVKSEGGVYYWHKSTGKTTWKFPSVEAKEHKKKQQSHTYINIRPGHRPYVVTTRKSCDAALSSTAGSKGDSVSNSTSKMSCISHKSGGSGGELGGERDGVDRETSERARNDGRTGRSREREVVSKQEKAEPVLAVSGNRETSAPSLPSEKEMSAANSASPQTAESGEDSGHYDSLSPDSPPSVRRRPLVVHNYENFPFNQPRERRRSDTEGVAGCVAATPPPTRSRTGSNVSSASSAPPIPERHYSESDTSGSPTQGLPDLSPSSPSPAPNNTGGTIHEPAVGGEGGDTLSPLHSTHSRSHQVKRELSEQGNEYAVVNPAWKKNVKGRPPSLTRVDDEDVSVERGTVETPPTVPDRPAEVSSPAEHTERGCIDLDSALVNQKRDELEISSRFTRSVKYTEVQISSQKPPAGLMNSDPTYDSIDDSKLKVKDDTYATIDETKVTGGGVKPRQSSSVRRRNERWLKTQSAYVTSSTSPPLVPPPPPPSSPPHIVTRTTDTPLYVNGLILPEEVPRGEEEEEEEEEGEDAPALPPKTGAKLWLNIESGGSENNRRLHALNVTIRRPSEAEESMTGGKMSKEALLLRSGVTLRPGVRPPRCAVSTEGRREREGGDGPSGSDEDDRLEPVSRAIRSLESRIGSTTSDQLDSAQQSQGDEETDGGGANLTDVGGANLMLMPDGPPNWTQCQRQLHKYEEVTILDDSSPEECPSGKFPRKPTSTRSVENLHMTWDESDVRGQSTAVKSSAGKGLVSASQPCLIDVDAAFPHLVKPTRVSDEAFQLRKRRLMKHKYEAIDIPVWGGGGGECVMSVGDVSVPSPALRNSWQEAEKESAVSDTGSMLPKGWQRMEDEQKRTYYWHIPTGRTQYTKPTGVSVSMENSVRSLSDQSDNSSASTRLPNIAAHSQSEVRGHKFSVRYLGNHPVEESELVPGECVKVVHKSINQINSAGQVKGKPLFLVIQGMEMQWVEPEATTPTTIQPINRIRVWGIGLDDEREFGYVARDQVTKKHKCHVFKCDMPARAVAKALLENHQKMSNKPSSSSQTLSGRENEPTPPSQRRAASPDVPSSHERTQTVSVSRAVSPPSVENVETTSCVYIGSCEVNQSQGIEVLNSAVEKLSANKSRWVNVNITISSSNINITDTKSDKSIGKHRVRFLCFLGIARDDRFCGYILESARGKKLAEKKFLFHGFRMEPNTDTLCLALHTACQARYQHELDRNPEAKRAQEREAERLRSKSTSSILGRLGSFKKNRREDDGREVFTVQYLGCQQVMKSEGLEVVKGPIQQLSIPKSAMATTPANLVEFEVSPSGLSMVDPQRRLFSRKNFSVKHITYVVRIRNYFAFVVRDGSKYQCYVFLETAVPAATIVTTIQRLLAPESSKRR